MRKMTCAKACGKNQPVVMAVPACFVCKSADE